MQELPNTLIIQTTYTPHSSEHSYGLVYCQPLKFCSFVFLILPDRGLQALLLPEVRIPLIPQWSFTYQSRFQLVRNLGGCSKFALMKYSLLLSKNNLHTVHDEVLPNDAAECIQQLHSITWIAAFCPYLPFSATPTSQFIACMQHFWLCRVWVIWLLRPGKILYWEPLLLQKEKSISSFFFFFLRIHSQAQKTVSPIASSLSSPKYTTVIYTTVCSFVPDDWQNTERALVLPLPPIAVEYNNKCLL